MYGQSGILWMIMENFQVENSFVHTEQSTFCWIKRISSDEEKSIWREFRNEIDPIGPDEQCSNKLIYKSMVEWVWKFLPNA